MSRERVIAYLSRITGSPVTGGQSIALASARKAAFVSWLRREAINFTPESLSAGSFTVEDLFDAAGPASPTGVAPITLPAAPAAPPGDPSGVLGVGIDIEHITSLPHADDFRAHEFYQDNFSPAEMAHCIQQSSPRASFCGLWAAKEAVLKSGAAAAGSGGLRSVEISHDPHGRPGFPDCLLSISHSDESAIAVSLWLRKWQPVPVPSPGYGVSGIFAERSLPENAQRSRSNPWLVLGAIALVVAAGLYFSAPYFSVSYHSVPWALR